MAHPNGGVLATENRGRGPASRARHLAGWGGLPGGARRITYVALLLLREMLHRLESPVCIWVLAAEEPGNLEGCKVPMCAR